MFQGCSSPLVVKFADTQKEKEQKKLQQMNANLLASFAGGTGGGGGGGGVSIGPQYLAVSRSHLTLTWIMCIKQSYTRPRMLCGLNQ